jgi:hydroxymethylbilane synthase
MSAEGLAIESSDGHQPPRQRIILGTRGSELAQAQTRMVEEALRAHWPKLEPEIEIIVTHGDKKMAPIDSKAGRKGLFTSEIERALLDGRIDIAVHSAKDLPSEVTAGLQIRAVLLRAAVEDVLIMKKERDLEAIPPGATIATGSVRRQHQVRWKRPDLRAVELRGNVPTRLRKLNENTWDAIILACAGLERLRYDLTRSHFDFEGKRLYHQLLPREEFLPAGGQGIIVLQVRETDARAKGLVDVINHSETFSCLRAERHFLRLLRGDCNQPVGVLATIGNASMKLRAQVFEMGAMAPRQATVEGTSEEPESLGARLFAQINGG